METPLRQINMQIPRNAMTSNNQNQQRLKLRSRPPEQTSHNEHSSLAAAEPKSAALPHQQRVVNSLKPVTTRMLNSEQTAKRQINNTQQPTQQAVNEMIL